MTHEPVLVEEFLSLASPIAGDKLLDATLGLGGHTRAFLGYYPGTTAVGLDADPAALTQAQSNLADYASRVTFYPWHFTRLPELLVPEANFSHVLLDLGLGTHQLDDSARSFSFKSHAPLSAMGYGDLPRVPSAYGSINWLEKRLGYPPSLADLTQQLPVYELARIIGELGEERFAQRLAAAIKHQQPESAHDLADLISRTVPASYAAGRLHPATRTFQAFRLAVNRELESLTFVLPQALTALRPSGLLTVISFHSLEDRIVKRFFKATPDLKLLTKKPLRATAAEKQRNPRARSAKLRAARKL
jgi:16S rRNA (cytosine1402-N4)-methyltransferase